ncbi:MAG: NADH-quinone oxidoreductase subunit M [Planctomycetota bacterium]|nr:NADH-quinone oxidoreductase subunit M [Planctomycetota bacterium]
MAELLAGFLIAIPLLAAILIGIAPSRMARWLGLLGGLATLGWGIVFASMYPFWSEIPQEGANLAGYWPVNDSWAIIPLVGLELQLGVNSVSLLLVLLTCLFAPLVVLASFTAITERVKEFYIWLMIMNASVIGVFIARDIITFYTAFEVSLIPAFFLVAIYGGPDRREASFKFFIYTLVGSIVMLAGFVYLVMSFADSVGGWLPSTNGGVNVWDIDALTTYAREFLTPGEQAWVLLALMLGFAVKVPLWPLHTWLPLAHNQAPTAGSVNFAAVILKLGAYGVFRFVIPMVPEAVVEFAPYIAGLAIIGIIYTSLVCWAQTDMKKLIAYSSIAHMGFCMIGLFALNPIGAQGGILYMITHGLSSGALFLCIGMMYERHHVKEIERIGGLMKSMPVWSFFVVLFTFVSVGLPGLAGFVSEFLCLLGTFVGSTESNGGYPGVLGPWFGIIAGVGLSLGAIYMLYLVGKVVFGEEKIPEHDHSHDTHPLPRDLNFREIITLVPIAIICFFIGLYPTPILEAIEPAAEHMLSAYPEIVEAASKTASAEAMPTTPEAFRMTLTD